MELQHFCHQHPLILCEEAKDVGEKDAYCSGCSDSVSDGPIYSCIRCEFFLHKSCAELPKKVLTTLHLAHHLELSLLDIDSLSIYCDICSETITGFGYSCHLCKFDLHITCASQHIFEPQSHDHHSFILLKPTSFTCNFCGIGVAKDVSFLCTTCQLQVHRKCSFLELPHTVKQIGHCHQLTLTYSYQLDDFSNHPCKICFRSMKGVICVYSCSSCAYVAHVHCATSEDLKDDDGAFVMEVENQERSPLGPVETDVGFLITTQEIKEMSPLEEDQIATEQIQHSSHPHFLILINDEPKSGEICDGCTQPISVPFYTCANQCDFLLHKKCAELPEKILHPVHVHPLILLPRDHEETCGLFNCCCCDVRQNGFSYKCEECNIFLDVTCSLLLDTLRHEGHPCTLSLISERGLMMFLFNRDNNRTKCSACDFDCKTKFRCEKCNFNLDLRCASLPHTAEHECPKHQWGMRPYKLTYFADDDGSGIFYCDICEERRGQNHWFYQCEDCKFYAHPRCVLGKYRIKFGKTYRLNFHPHPIILGNNSEGHPPCAGCGNPCKDGVVLLCTECNINFDFCIGCLMA